MTERSHYVTSDDVARLIAGMTDEQLAELATREGSHTPWHRRKVKKFTESETKAILHNVNAKLGRMVWR